MDVDSFIQGLGSCYLQKTEEFLISWLPFLTKGFCEGCSSLLYDRIRSLSSLTGQVQTAEEAQSAAFKSVVEAVGGDHVQGLPNGFYHNMENLDTEREKNVDAVVEEEIKEVKETVLSRDHTEQSGLSEVERKKDFACLERVNGRMVNILEGLELHTNVFSASEQENIVDYVYQLQEQGRSNQFGEHTYSEPKKWMRGKGRVTIQFGCCYNYAEKNGILPGIIRHAAADRIPSIFKAMIKKLIGWNVLPVNSIPDSCIVNIYEPGDCIPPHIDSHDFKRPFCTVSFLSECNIVFGSNLKIAGPGNFVGSTSIPLPLGSVLVLNGYGADVAKHCVPSVPFKRISITFRKMDQDKWPHGFKLEPDLQNIRPCDLIAGTESKQENMGKEPIVEEIQVKKMKLYERLVRTKRNSRHSDDSEEHLERTRHHDLMGDYGGRKSEKRWRRVADMGKKPTAEGIQVKKMKLYERLIGAKKNYWHSDDSEEHLERTRHHDLMEDYGGRKSEKRRRRVADMGKEPTVEEAQVKKMKPYERLIREKRNACHSDDSDEHLERTRHLDLMEDYGRRKYEKRRRRVADMGKEPTVEEAQVKKMKPYERLIREKRNACHSDDSDEHLERTRHLDLMEDYGRRKFEKRRRRVADSLEFDNKSSIRRHSYLDSRHSQQELV